MFMIAPVTENCDTYDGNDSSIETILEITLHVELRNRFVVTCQKDGTILMIFTAMHFNVSPVLKEDRILFVAKIYDIRRDAIILQTFLFDFLDDEIAKLFHEYAKKGPYPVTDNMIPVVVPYRIHYLYNRRINDFSPR